jgi:hypothetical protein
MGYIKNRPVVVAMANLYNTLADPDQCSRKQRENLWKDVAVSSLQLNETGQYRKPQLPALVFDTFCEKVSGPLCPADGPCSLLWMVYCLFVFLSSVSHPVCLEGDRDRESIRCTLGTLHVSHCTLHVESTQAISDAAGQGARHSTQVWRGCEGMVRDSGGILGDSVCVYSLLCVWSLQKLPTLETFYLALQVSLSLRRLLKM